MVTFAAAAVVFGVALEAVAETTNVPLASACTTMETVVEAPGARVPSEKVAMPF
jgi:hypothetical protein